MTLDNITRTVKNAAISGLAVLMLSGCGSLKQSRTVTIRTSYVPVNKPSLRYTSARSSNSSQKKSFSPEDTRVTISRCTRDKDGRYTHTFEYMKEYVFNPDSEDKESYAKNK